MYSNLFLLRCCRLSSFKFCHSVIVAKSFHSISSNHLLRSCVPATNQVRSFWESFPYVRPLLYEKDGLSREKYEIVYRSTLFNYAFYGQLISMLTIVSEIGAGIYVAFKSFIMHGDIETTVNVGPYLTNLSAPLSVVLLALFNLQNLAILIAAQTAVFRVYYCEKAEQFVFVKLALNPFKSKLLHCGVGELIRAKENPLDLILGNHELNGVRMYINYENFKSIYLYNMLLGNNDE